MQLCGKSVRLWCDGSSDRSFMVDPLSYFLFQPGVTKVMVCAILSVGWCISKNPCCYSERVAYVAASGFLFCYLSGPLPYV